MSDGLENSYTKYIKYCSDCPLYNIYHLSKEDIACNHPRSSGYSSLFNGEGDCPLITSPLIIKVQKD